MKYLIFIDRLVHLYSFIYLGSQMTLVLGGKGGLFL